MKPPQFLEEMKLIFFVAVSPFSFSLLSPHTATLRPTHQLYAPGISCGSQAVIFKAFISSSRRRRLLTPSTLLRFSCPEKGWVISGKVTGDRACDKDTAKIGKAISDRAGLQYEGEWETGVRSASASAGKLLRVKC